MKRSEANTARYALTLVAAVLTGVGLAAAVTAVSAQDDTGASGLDADFRHELDLAPGAELRIMNGNGRVVVKTGGRDKAVVTISKRVTFVDYNRGWLADWLQGTPEVDDAARDAIASIEPEIQTDSDRIEISSLTFPPRNDVIVEYHYDITIPPGRNLTVATANGPVHISGVEGTVSAASENGDVKCDTIHGNLAARARNGGVYLRRIDGALRAEAMNGPIRVDSRDVSQVHPLECSSENGPILVHLPGRAAFDLRASAINGHVDTGFKVGGEKPQRPVHAIKGPVGVGGPAIALNTFNGSIYLNAS